MAKGNELKLSGRYTAKETCSVIHAEGSTVLATYDSDYFAGSPALTVNSYGEGKAYYIASRNSDEFLRDFYRRLITSLSLDRVIDADLPNGVTAQARTDGATRYLFLMNFTDQERSVKLDSEYTDVLSEKSVRGSLALGSFGARVLERAI